MQPVLLYFSISKPPIAHGTCEVWVKGNVSQCHTMTAITTDLCYNTLSLCMNNRINTLIEIIATHRGFANFGILLELWIIWIYSWG